MLVSTVQQSEAEFPVLYSRFSLFIYFIHISVCMLVPISQFIPPCLSPLVSICLFFTSVSLFLPCKPVHLYHFSRFHKYLLICSICFSLSDLLHSVWQSLGPSTSLQITQFCSFLCLSNKNNKFLAALGLRCCARAFSSCGEPGVLFVVVLGLLIVVASLAHRLQ